MKRMMLLLVCALSYLINAQTNHFPPNGNAGIGTTSPSHGKLQIYGNGPEQGINLWTNSGEITSRLWIDNQKKTFHLSKGVNPEKGITLDNNGFIGIGTTTPKSLFNVSSGTSGDAIFRLEADTDNNNEADNPMIQLRQDGDIIGVDMGFSENFGENQFGIAPWHSAQGGNRWDTFVINIGNGNVGIGTKTIEGNWKLAVKGKIRAEEIKVETGWADYVFKEDYNLPTLQEVEQHIQEKGHLINIPTAQEVEENGIELGEMNKLLLEKIEELTLYVIALKKENEEIKKSIKHLRK
ncbi:hypothetical protein L0P88_18960 [Muricauda sp. SCSIO 64092]|uniref:hypothetical protein n=1 Tax=Allomuricauda sp. SCSIO 64092 TaxID=2908842 RepID=UPI001FF4DD1B|nr:hypothetical protein [Muricauda sp. SCSIO 64092]UOY06003.1 hypothetical protein L0P88_18960 [Muricauda sp. SCSIO 64092]